MSSARCVPLSTLQSSLSWFRRCAPVLSHDVPDSVGHYARQCFGFLDPVFDRTEARKLVNMFLLLVDCREFFVEMIRFPLRQFLDRIYARSSEKLRVLPANPFDPKQIRFIDPFQNQMMRDPGFLDQFFTAIWSRTELQKILHRFDSVRLKFLGVRWSDTFDFVDVCHCVLGVYPSI